MTDKQIIADNERQQHQRQPQKPQQPPLQMGYPSFKFDPRDHELIKNFLEKKIKGIELRYNPMYEVNIYQYHPRDLTERCKPQGKNDVWYFLTPREKKHKFGVRPARNVGDNGFWKAVGADKKIRDDVDENEVIGLRKSLNYFEGRQSGVDKSQTTTGWKMHEYQTLDQAESSKAKIEQLKRTRHAPTSMRLDVVLCKIYCKKKKDVKEKKAATRNRTPRVNSAGKDKGKGKVKAEDNNPRNNQIELPVASEMKNSKQESEYNTGCYATTNSTAATTTTATNYDGQTENDGSSDEDIYEAILNELMM